MAKPLTITDVARRTGLTPRALRFYEARGLVAPLRTAAGRRLYDAATVARLGQIVALKAAGFTLADIARLLDRRPFDLAALVAAQLAALDRRAADLDAARALLLAAQSRIARGEPLDAATLCSLIRTGDQTMTTDDWKTVTDRYTTPEEQRDWDAARAQVPLDFDQDAYARQWQDLGTRVAAHLPLDPASPQAQALYDEWQALLAPFLAIATPAMGRSVNRLYDAIPEWQGEQQPPFSADVWQFIKAAGEARKAGATPV